MPRATRLTPFLLVLLLLGGAATGRAADRTSSQTLHLASGPLAFTAAVETVRLTDPKGAAVAEIVTTGFWGEGAGRPVTFVFNGGPGAASAWMDVGAVGPWRVPARIPVMPSQDPTPADNEDTWLGFTDLVFVDPVGTGFSRTVGEGKSATFQSVDGDIESLATVVRRWLVAHGRLAAPVFLLGESYGGFRLPRLARTLLQEQGVGVAGLVMVSPVLDFNGRDAPYDPLRWVAQLPSLVALARGATDRAALADAEAYAAGPYLTDLLRGPADPEARARMVGQVATLTGLDPAMVARREGRPDWDSILRGRRPGRVASPYDLTIDAADPFPAAPHDDSPDAVLDGLRAPITSGMLMVYDRLGWQPEGAPNRHYALLADEVAKSWDWGRGGRPLPQSMSALRQYLALDPAARAVVVHGLTDLVTPYFASKLLLDQLPPDLARRAGLVALPGGHMMYLQDGSRARLREAGRALIGQALAARAASPP